MFVKTIVDVTSMVLRIADTINLIQIETKFNSNLNCCKRRVY